MERKPRIETGQCSEPVVDYLLGMKYDARATTLARLKNLAQEELDWQPYEGWNSIGALLSHIIASDHYFTIHYLTGRTFTEEEKQKWMPGMELGKYVSELKGRPLEYYIHELKLAFEQTTNALKSFPAGKLFERRYDDYDKVNGADLAWILYHAAEDEVHHRGQISILRKLYKMRNVQL
jgi:uncharacterized damage-inducible protein DinB